MKLSTILIFTLLFGCFPALSQICDDFSDGDFSSNPSWTGDVENFIVNDNAQLQLNATTAGNSMLVLETSLGNTVQWDLFINMDFAPSASNQLRIYLASDQEDLLLGNGYFLEIGASGADDPIILFKQVAGATTKIGESATGIAGNEPVTFRLKIRRNEDGQWAIDGDPTGGENLIPLFSANDSELSIAGNAWFGFYCKYSATRVDKFYFDDICVGPIIADMTPPSLLNLEVLSNKSIQLNFSELLNESAAEVSNFTLTPGGAQPINANLFQTKITLEFQAPFESGLTYTLEWTGVEDLSGNIAPLQSTNFTYVEVMPLNKFDLLINEIMADPSPTISLPDAEYLEIFHNGTFTIDLSTIQLMVGNTNVALPTYIMQPGDYLILTDADMTQSFVQYGDVVGIDLPGLTNSGASISLLDNLGNEIHRIAYESNWYADGQKDDGGWSLELMNPLNICVQKENWRASNDLRGGTPGKENSILEVDPDVTGPKLVRAQPIDDKSILIQFDEALSNQNLVVSNFEIQPNITINSVLSFGDQAVVLKLSDALSVGLLYELRVLSIADCQQNPATTIQSINIGLPVIPQPGDLLINEILFNPATGGARFVELLNVTNKVLSTGGLVVGQIIGSETDLNSIAVPHLILPNEFVVVTPDPDDIKLRYNPILPNNVIESELPSWGPKQGNVTILFDGEVLDVFNYNESFHSPLLDDQNGVSLERVSPLLATNQGSSWHSASQDVGFATPTGPNSQVLSTLVPNIEFELINSTFSPDQDGFKDFLGIQFVTPSESSIATVSIYDASGRLVRNLVKNESVSRMPFIKWDGTDDDGQLNRVGMYIIFVNIFSPTGETRQYKESCVLAQKLN